MNTHPSVRFRLPARGLAAGCAAALLAVASWAEGASSPPQAVDVHAHALPTEYIQMLRRHGAEMEESFPLPAWDAASHVRFMEKAGIACSVITLPAPQPCFDDAAENRRVVRQINETYARTKAAWPGKFRFCATLPLPDVEAAIDEAVYALDTLRADGVKLATNSRGLYLGDARLDPLMAVLNERHAVLIVHPHRPDAAPDKLAAPFPLYEYPAETTRALVNMIARNVPARYPNIRIVVPHCGSFLPLALPRLRALLPAMAAKGLMQPVDWEANLAHLYYDLAGTPTPDVMKTLLTIAPPDHILYGSDYPYLPEPTHLANMKQWRAALAADPALAPYADMFSHENARRLFERAPAPRNRAADETAPAGQPSNREAAPERPHVRVATLTVDPARLDEYKTCLREHAETAMRAEPGVLTLYAVFDRKQPNRATILEIYADRDAYERHLKEPHFLKYKHDTRDMVLSLELADASPLVPEMNIKKLP